MLELGRRQIEYAAQDVHVALELFKWFAEKIAPGRDPTFIIEHHLSRYINLNYGPSRN